MLLLKEQKKKQKTMADQTLSNFIWCTHTKVVHRDSKRVENLGINSIILQVDQVHLLSDLLQGCLWAQSCQISSHMTVCFCCDLHAHMHQIEISTNSLTYLITFIQIVYEGDGDNSKIPNLCWTGSQWSVLLHGQGGKPHQKIFF